ncbi:ABC transporter substrate-binding protein [Candidatus Deferrimicrobium sp.]|uniref:ABC transporter substrate-binding protein n=1 Tax=Candidatus Deferrimicrobium sp. TaxID=3060586 RepID=UPI002ED5F106
MKTLSKVLLAVAVLLLGVFQCGGAFAETVKVGVLLPLTGAQAKFGEIERRSYEMAAEEINAKGGVNGKKIELLFEDDTGKPDVGRSGVEKLISREKVPVITGGYSSSVTAASAPVAQQFKVPFVICTGSADDITEKGYDYVFRINQVASEYPNAVESFLKEVAKDVKTVALLYENSAFGQSSSKSFEGDANRLGLKIVVKEGYQAGAIDFKPILTKVKAANPDMVYMVSYVMDASLLMRQSKELRINPKMFVGGGAGFTLPEFAKSAGDAADGVFSATLWIETLPFPGAKEYFNKFKKKFGSDTEYHGAEAYAAMYVVADALKRAKSITPKDVRDALAKTDMKTAFGPVKFVSYGKKTQQNKLDTYLVQWRKGELNAVWPKSAATMKYIYPTPPWDKRK